MNAGIGWKRLAVVVRGVALAGLLVATAQASPSVCGDVVNEDGVKASDALAVLKEAVGTPQDLACPSSVARVMAFDEIWSPLVLPGNNGSTVVKPEKCRTSEYLAGENEIAMIAVSGSASPTDNVTDVLYIEPVVSKNDGLFMHVQSSFSAESLIDGTAHASTVVAFPLEAGATYVFGAGFASNSQVSISVGSCLGTVQIVRPAIPGLGPD